MGFSFSVYSIHPHSKLSQFFSHLRKEHLYISLNIHIPRSHGKKIFCFPLRHHSCLIKLTLLQLHHHTLLIKLTNAASLHHIPYTCPLIKLTHIKSLHHNCYTRSISKLYHSNIISHCSGSTHLIPSDFQLLELKFIFISFSQKFASYSIFNYIWNTSKLLLLSGDVEINQVRDQSTKTQYSVPSAPEKLTEGHSRIWHLPAPTRIAAHVVINPVTVYQSAKLVMQKILVALSSGNTHNMSLESLKSLCHLLPSMNNQIDPLLWENLASFAWILSVPVMLI